MTDRNWERERMRDRGHEGNRENWGRERENWRENDWNRNPQYSADDRNRDREGRDGYGGEEWNRGRDRGEPYGEGHHGYPENRGYYGTEGRSNEGRGLDREDDRRNEGYRDGGQHNEGNRRGYSPPRGDYGPRAFTSQFRQGTELYGTGQRGFGTDWGGANGMSLGGYNSYSGGLGTYGDPGRHTGRGPKGYKRSDDRIREDVCERLTQHPDIDASEIDIQVKDGELTLTGTVERRDEKRMAEDVAESVSGVKDVHNQLRAHPHQVTTGQGTQGVQANRETTSARTK